MMRFTAESIQSLHKHTKKSIKKRRGHKQEYKQTNWLSRCNTNCVNVPNIRMEEIKHTCFNTFYSFYELVVVQSRKIHQYIHIYLYFFGDVTVHLNLIHVLCIIHTGMSKNLLYKFSSFHNFIYCYWFRCYFFKINISSLPILVCCKYFVCCNIT